MKPKPSPAERLGRLKSLRYLKPHIDHDYLRKLSPEELGWLAKFDEDFYQGKGQRIWSKRHDALTVADSTTEDNRATVSTSEDILIALEEVKSSRDK